MNRARCSPFGMTLSGDVQRMAVDVVMVEGADVPLRAGAQRIDSRIGTGPLCVRGLTFLSVYPISDRARTHGHVSPGMAITSAHSIRRFERHLVGRAERRVWDILRYCVPISGGHLKRHNGYHIPAITDVSSTVDREGPDPVGTDRKRPTSSESNGDCLHRQSPDSPGKAMLEHSTRCLLLLSPERLRRGTGWRGEAGSTLGTGQIGVFLSRILTPSWEIAEIGSENGEGSNPRWILTQLSKGGSHVRYCEIGCPIAMALRVALYSVASKKRSPTPESWQRRS